MSGGSFQYAYLKSTDVLIREHFDDQLRDMADAITREGSIAGRRLTGREQEQIAAILRAKADRVQGARLAIDAVGADDRGGFQQAIVDEIDGLFHDDLRDLMKAVEYAQSGDYGPGAVRGAWEEYGEP